MERLFPPRSLTSRRHFLGTAEVATLVLASPPALADATAETASTHAETVRLTVNGRQHALDLDPRTTLLDALREHLALTGTKKGCDQGQCGACTVIVNGQRINSCLTLAVMHAGDEITTIEGLAEDGDLHPMQAAFVHHDGLQCGYCTPGQICSAVALLAEHKAGWPSHVTADVATRARPDRYRDRRADERQYLPVRRLCQHRRGNPRCGRGRPHMKPFRYERASGVASACASAAEPTAKFIAGGTNLIDLMKLQIETPARLVDIGMLPLAEIEETAERRPAHRRAGHQQRPRRRHARPPPLSAAVTGDPGGRVDAASQQGHDRRESAPAHAVPLFL